MIMLFPYTAKSRKKSSRALLILIVILLNADKDANTKVHRIWECLVEIC